MSPATLRLRSLVFMGAALPLLGLYGLLLMISTPNATGGMAPIVATVCYTAFTCIFGALTVVVINFSRQLAREATGEYTTP